MSEGDGMAEVTEADRQAAGRIIANWMVNFSADQPDALAAMIETNLAHEREKARAPFLAVLADLDDGFFAPESYDKGVRWASDRFRRVAQEG